jgi:capsule biosynthesis phosphatase
MILLIPIGGLGTRFSKLGYKKPKPLIDVLGKPILFWLLDNLDLSASGQPGSKRKTHRGIAPWTKIVIPYNPSLSEYRFEDLLKKTYPKLDFLFVKLLGDTEGASHTIKLALEELEKLKYEDENILCLDSDNFYTTNVIKRFVELENKNVVITFEDKTETPIYSYCKTKNNKIIEIKEKEKISDYASCGGYGFNSWKQLLKTINIIMEKKIKQKNEYYTSTVISYLIKNNNEFNILNINKNDFVCLGTPLQVRLFCNNYPKYSIDLAEKINKKRFCFDLDNTLVTFPVISGDYTSVKPIQENINFLKYLKNFGHEIIIYTARRMKTHKGNNGKLLRDIGKITFDTLEKFDIPYDEIYFGKPHADYYIDDLAVNAFENLEKELGFYKNNIDPRSFNSVESVSISLYRKKSDDLSGEIYYYKNIPNEIKDLFPIMIRNDVENKWYDMEKINGIPISKLYLSEELTIENLDVIFKSVERIHNIKCKLDNKINIYKNYVNKLENRYKLIDYGEFRDSEKIYVELKNYFENYEKNDNGEKSVIHGDTVFTNIMINQFGKIKLIDMRGKVGNKLTIFGDKFYDLAKIYQSLTGYEEVLGNKIISSSYKNNLKKHFEKTFHKDLDKIKMIKKLLVFTLIPLHDKNNRHKLWELIF